MDKGIEQIQAHGMDGLVYGEALQTWEERLFSLARAALGSDEQVYLAPLVDFVAHKFWWNVH